MTDPSPSSAAPIRSIPDDDPARALTVARSDEDQTLPHIGVVGDTYTLIDMVVPPGGGPGPHRHDFEEMFTILEGEIELTFRGATSVAGPGTTINVPANAPHRFHNAGDRTARVLCLCSPAGQEEFFKAIGVPLATRTEPAPALDATQTAAFLAKAAALAPAYRTELLAP
jgi:quercetin dioxygenase-like cupin family protein